MLKKILRIFVIAIICIIVALNIYILTILSLRFIKAIFPDPITYLSTNWKIDIPKPNDIKYIYYREFGDGEDLEIWYYEEERIKEIINNNKFKKIDKQSKEFIQQEIDDYYGVLDDNEKNLFDMNIDVQYLLEEENYFTYVTDKDNEASWLLLILDSKTGKLYYFTNIY